MHSGYRRYLYHQGNEKTTGGTVEAAAIPFNAPVAGMTECAVDCGGGEEGEQADEEEAGQEEQGGEQHRSLEQLSEVLVERV